MSIYHRITFFFVVGLFLSAATTVTLSRVSPPARNTSDPPNVVVLRSEKRVSLVEMKVPAKDILAGLSLQTGYEFEVDPEFDLEKGRYTALVTSVPLRDFLDATGELFGGKWERTRSGYRLRPLSPEEILAQTDQYEDLLRSTDEFIREVDRSDRDPEELARLAGMASVLQSRPMDVPIVAPEVLPLLQVQRSGDGLAIGYVQTGPNGSGSLAVSMLWGQAGTYRFGMGGGSFNHEPTKISDN